MEEQDRGWPRLTAAGTPWLLAHRGGHGEWRENTLEAFSGALASGADGVELDVRRAADGSLVVHHDATVEGIGPVHELAMSQFPPWVPTLAQALAACAGAAVNVEIKNSPAEHGFDPDEEIAARVVEALETFGAPPTGLSAPGPGSRARSGSVDCSPAQVVVSSFSPATLGAVKATGAEVPIGLLVHPAFDPFSVLAEAASLGCAALHPFCGQVTAELVDRAHHEQMGVVTWTVNDPLALRAVLEAGVDGVITDEVALAVEVLGAEGGLVRDRDRRGQSGP